ncbi:hypothetical protein B0H67DRAFT_551188 [Lasiosphaeris hirsuta]|uniref:Uncharacterized protein n=1 Tax=Lasiosphaeris hirsuta TaxID=260670 RepID=A0AA40B1B3_9PEZI|nr:hypothetical protein B0H67DRAFT_551188 [Lasiosphaeris hirsuta]
MVAPPSARDKPHHFEFTIYRNDHHRIDNGFPELRKLATTIGRGTGIIWEIPFASRRPANITIPYAEILSSAQKAFRTTKQAYGNPSTNTTKAAALGFAKAGFAKPAGGKRPLSTLARGHAKWPSVAYLGREKE